MSRTLRLICGAIVVLAFLAYGVSALLHNPAWRNFDWHKLLLAIRQIRPTGLLGAVLLMYMTYFLRACRWYEFLRPVKETDIRRNFYAMVMGFGAVAVLGRPGELVRPYMIARQEGTPVSSQMAVWILERFCDTVAMVLVVGGGFLLGGVGTEDTGAPVAPLLIGMRRAGITLLVATVVGVILLIVYEERLRAGGRVELKWLPERYAHKVRDALASFAQGLAGLRSARAVTLGVVYSLTIWVTIAAAFWMVLQAFGPPLDDLDFASSMLVMGFSIAGSVVQAPGVGGGSQVLAILALTEIYGVQPEIATTAGIVLWGLAFMAVVPLAAVVGLQQGVSLRSLRLMAKEQS
jgi:glycosyltransferase 2 family protein